MIPSRQLPTVVVRRATGVLAIALWVTGAWTTTSVHPWARTDVTPAGLLAIAGGPASCDDDDHYEKQGSTAGTEAKVCQGSGPVYIGAAQGQAAWVVGPTVTGPAQVNAVVAAGDALMGY
jgi:hypothetical protein